MGLELTNVGNLTSTNTSGSGSSTVNVNSVNILNSAGWIVGLTAGPYLVGSINTLYAGSTQTINILNSAGWLFSQINTANAFYQINTGGNIFASQSGTWNVQAGSLSLINSAGWVVGAQQNSAWSVSVIGGSINIVNSAGWSVVNAAGANLIGSANVLYAGSTQTINILNSAGWSVVNAAGAALMGSVNTLYAGSTQPVFAYQISSWSVNIIGGSINIVNSANWLVFNKEQPDATATYAPLNTTVIAYTNNLIVKNAAGVLFALNGYNSKSAAQFVQLYNTTSLAAEGATPILMLYVPGLSNFSYSADKFGRFFSVGITVCNSLSGPTKTIGSSDCWFDAQYQ